MALEKVNEKLRAKKEEIPEGKLVDGASRIMKLGNDGFSMIDNLFSDDNNEGEVKEFFLLIKLRRKILNRLFRRLNRVSRSMDGQTSCVGPPLPPKFGDMSFEFDDDDEAVKKFIVEHTKKNEYIQRQISKKDDDDRKLVENAKEEENKEEDEDTTMDVDRKDEESSSEDTKEEKQNDSSDPVIEYDAGYNRKISISASYDKVLPFVDDEKKDEAEGEAAEQQHQQEEVFSEVTAIKHGNGVGALLSLNHKERIAEYKRWKQNLYLSISDQPTFQDLGMNVVFQEERMRKKLKKEESNSTAADKEKENESSETEKDNTKDEEMSSGPGSPDKASASEKDDEEVADEKSKEEMSPIDSDTNEPKKEKSLLENNKESVEPIKTRKQFSVSAVPSFYNQDLNRILAIQYELLENDVQKNIHGIVERAQQEYDQRFKTSTHLNSIKSKLMAEHNKLTMTQQALSQRLNASSYAEIALRRNKWLARKAEWNHIQARKRDMHKMIYSGQLKVRVIVEDVVKNMVEKIHCLGTTGSYEEAIPTYGDPIRKEVKKVLVDLVDDVFVRNSIKSFHYNPDEKFEDNHPAPGMPEGSSGEQAMLADFHKREQVLRKQIKECIENLEKAEVDRERAWKHLIKVKGEAQSQLSRHAQLQSQSNSVGAAQQQAMRRRMAGYN
eukprot:CAMPEP_0178954456 /NCGR_PEP_ID=MMETSP0789-20121207/8997_1 /TAXON_ID=3005 /ORGANISM="Rhizosolenia setigera, Strain CCMP 1694" /LENGTH=667 /DNA_ID=CAMNT_0020635853 /DNA_START=173 /DNA_END=2176 /DNA_ORIENTATION=-